MTIVYLKQVVVLSFRYSKTHTTARMMTETIHRAVIKAREISAKNKINNNKKGMLHVKARQE